MTLFSLPRASNLLVLFALLLIVPLAGCDDDDDPAVPGVEPEVVNQVDNFQFQTSGVQNYSGELSYVWSMTGTRAVADHSCSISAGSGTLLLFDADGTQVYSRDLAEDGTWVSDEGTAGDWEIRILFDELSGTLNFRVDRQTP